jgi:hypothetical protein
MMMEGGACSGTPKIDLCTHLCGAPILSFQVEVLQQGVLKLLFQIVSVVLWRKGLAAR